MADKNISTLPAAESINDDSLFVMEQQGTAMKASGMQIAEFAKSAADANVQAAIDAAKIAEAAAAVTAHPPQANEDTGYWQTWDPVAKQYEDTTMKAQGPVGPQGDTITDIQRTSGTGAAGTTDIYTITTSGGNTYTFTVYNGADGQGAGDMLKSVYDPHNKNQDIFKYTDDAISAAITGAIGGSY